MSRRAFLQSIPLIAGCTRSAGPSCAVIGCGGYGSWHAERLLAAGARITWIADPDESALARTLDRLRRLGARGVQPVRDFRRALEDPGLDAVSIVTPDHWHALAVRWALEASKHVFVEPPLARTFEEVSALGALARDKGRVLSTALSQRAFGGAVEALKHVRSGRMGPVHQAKISSREVRPFLGEGGLASTIDDNLWLGPAPERAKRPKNVHRDWRWFWDYGRGAVGGAGYHRADLALLGLGLSSLEGVTLAIGLQREGSYGETPEAVIAVHKANEHAIVWDVFEPPSEEISQVLFDGVDSQVRIADLSAEFLEHGHPVGGFMGPRGDPFARFLATLAGAAQPWDGSGSSLLVELVGQSLILGRTASIEEATSALAAHSPDHVQDLERSLYRWRKKGLISGLRITLGALVRCSAQEATGPQGRVAVPVYRAPFAP